MEPANQQPGELSDLLLIAPRPEDIRRFQDSYADPTTLDRCLQMRQRLADRAAVVVVTTMSDLALIQSKLLPLCGAGFKRARILLPQCPSSPDVTDDPVLVIAARGEMEISLPKGGWLGDVGPLEAAKVVERLVPDAKQRLHAFASVKSEGWRCLMNGDAWVEEPSVRCASS